MVMTRGHASLLIGALALTAAGILVSRQPAPQETPATAGSPIIPSSRKLPEIENQGAARQREAMQKKGRQKLPLPSEAPFPPGSPDNEEWISTRITALQDLAWFDDPESLKKILAELHSPLPEIRAAALEATIDFSSNEAIPYLEVISAGTYDVVERGKITEAIEFLKLPTLTEHLESIGAETGQEPAGAPSIPAGVPTEPASETRETD